MFDETMGALESQSQSQSQAATLRDQVAAAMNGKYQCTMHGYHSAILPCPQPECTPAWQIAYTHRVPPLYKPPTRAEITRGEVVLEVAAPRTFRRQHSSAVDRGALGEVIAVRTLWVWVEETTQQDVDESAEEGAEPL